jgi:hypothetical protein
MAPLVGRVDRAMRQPLIRPVFLFPQLRDPEETQHYIDVGSRGASCGVVAGSSSPRSGL